MIKNKALLMGGISVLVLLTAALFYLTRRKTDFHKLKGKKDYNYILVTVDTLRADRIGCYGFSQIETPYMNLFAARGIKFERCIAQTPLTLPSHTSIMTGTYPVFHGVRDNGGFIVPPQLDTIAELFKKKGYQTSGFVAAYVLDSKWGINQGFDHYFDQFDLSRYKAISLGNVQRPADEVIDEVLTWLEKHKSEKFFTWIHLYDPHTPYEPPSPYLEKYPGHPYLGEIAFTDYQLGHLWRYLEENDLVDNTIFVFASDHGESLGEHQESTHGFFVYQEAVHVPLIFVTPIAQLQGLSRSQVVNLVDIMPTVLEIAEIPVPDRVQGKSLVPFFLQDKNQEEVFAYCETYYPRFHFGWSDLKSIQDDRFKLILAPKLELYDLSEDPEERENLIDKQPDEGRRLKGIIDAFLERTSQNAFEMDYRNLDEETREKLAALGYIGSFTDSSQLQGKTLANPKDKIGVFNRLSKARELGLQGEFLRAEKMIQGIIQEDPDIIDAYFALGNLYFKNEQFEKAIQYFSQALDRKPDDAFTIINIANSYMRLGKLDEAEKIILDSMEAVPPDSQLYLMLGNIYKLKSDHDKAVTYYQKCLAANPYSASAYNNLGAVYIIQEKLDDAEKNIKKAMGLNPQLRNVHFNFAQLLEERKEFSQAVEEYRLELENIPHNFRASFNLSRVYRLLGQEDKEEEYLEHTIDINPNFPMSYFYLARIYLNRGEKFEEAISLVKKGIELKPGKENLPLGYFLLADLYNRLGDSRKSDEYARMGKSLTQSSSEKR